FRLGGLIGVLFLFFFVMMMRRHRLQLAFRLFFAGGKRGESTQRPYQKEHSNRFDNHGGETSSPPHLRASPENEKTAPFFFPVTTPRHVPSGRGRCTTRSASPEPESRTNRGKAAPADPRAN